ncbi:MAG: FAD:protein FMN transferase [Lachnospiraceae bacterium]|nr:FAD:protein FMN transferase [Lachnospiraceae bacterium]
MKTTWKPFLATFIILCGITLFLNGCTLPDSAVSTRESHSFFALDTYITLTIYDAGKQDLYHSGEQLVKDYESLFSATMPDSDIYRINHARGEWAAVSDETIDLLQTALDYCARSEGALDITLLPVKNLWDFTGESPCIPSETDLQKALTHVSFQNVEIDGNNVRLTDPESMIDLGFIAKGYICDRLREHLTDNGVKHALLALGGNISVIGTKPDGASFKVGIQKPFSDLGTPITTVSLSDDSKHTGKEFSCAVTSGIYERYFEQDGQIYHHILNPSTGYPAESDLSSVTILTDSSTEGDALSTLCLLMGSKKATAYIEEKKDIEAIFILRADQKIVHVYGKHLSPES